MIPKDHKKCNSGGEERESSPLSDLLAIEENAILLSHSLLKIFTPTDESSHQILRALSNRMTRHIYYHLITQGPHPLTHIATSFDISLNLAKYHLTNLERAGLVEISGIRYSCKGRKMKIYKSRSLVFLFVPTLERDSTSSPQDER